MAGSLDGAHFSTVLVGTSLAQSILAAALAKSGRSVLHLDHRRVYGAEDASLSLDELIEAAECGRLRDAILERASTGLGLSRQYCISLAPSILPAVGPLVGSLVASGVGQYTGFRLLDSVAMFSDGAWKRVPSSKADVFRDSSLSLPDKRRLMKALIFAAGDFEGSSELHSREDMPLLDFLTAQFGLSHALATSIAYAVALSPTRSEPTLPALRRLRTYLRSTGRYGASPFLVGQYGGAGELAQGFCRLSAVFGGVYMLGEDVSSVEQAEDGRLRLIVGKDEPQTVTADSLVVAPEYRSLLPASTSEPDLLSESIARGVWIVSELPTALRTTVAVPASEPASDSDAAPIKDIETALFVLPPIEPRTSPWFAMVVGESTFACHAGQFVIYLSAEKTADRTPREDLQPLIDALALDASPSLLSLSYTDHRSCPSGASSTPNAYTLASLCGLAPAEACDDALRAAEAVWHRLVGDDDLPMFTAGAPAVDDE